MMGVPALVILIMLCMMSVMPVVVVAALEGRNHSDSLVNTTLSKTFFSNVFRVKSNGMQV